MAEIKELELGKTNGRHLGGCKRRRFQLGNVTERE